MFVFKERHSQIVLQIVGRSEKRSDHHFHIASVKKKGKKIPLSKSKTVSTYRDILYRVFPSESAVCVFRFKCAGCLAARVASPGNKSLIPWGPSGYSLSATLASDQSLGKAVILLYH